MTMWPFGAHRARTALTNGARAEAERIEAERKLAEAHERSAQVDEFLDGLRAALALGQRRPPRHRGAR